jgi:hypothetical protein
MPFTWNVNAAKGQVHVTLTAPYTRDQGRAAAAAVVSDPAFSRTFGFIVDAIGPVGPEFVRDVRYFFATHREKFLGQRVAIVLGLGSAGVSRHRIAESGETADAAMAIRMFRTYKEAERWLSTGGDGTPN